MVSCYSLFFGGSRIALVFVLFVLFLCLEFLLFFVVFRVVAVVSFVAVACAACFCRLFCFYPLISVLCFHDFLVDDFSVQILLYAWVFVILCFRFWFSCCKVGCH